MRWTVIGLGAVGGLYGSRLHMAGEQVQYLVRADAAHIRQHGLHVASPLGNFTDPNPRVAEDPSELEPCDAVLVALKTTANPILDKLLPRLVAADGLVLMLQNGLDVERDAARSRPEARILGGLCFVCSHKRGPGRIEHLDFGPVTLGAWQANEAAAGATDDCTRIAALLNSSSVVTTIADDLVAARWGKLCWNIPYNGLSVLHQADTRALMDTPAWRREVEQLMDEVSAAAAACGKPLPAGHRDKMLANTDRMVPYLPSMRLDHDAGRPLEVEAIYGRAVRAAEAKGVAVPLMRSVYERLAAL
ncbi:MAG: 2-dehydropantoate 2-reductase [Planctomycetota bacterium]|jgi:2-dehydropantoate 2-reductase|nr:2-dehydropantoate 2-reductase [Planctomycetota bacterium]